MKEENNLASIVSLLKKVDLPGNRSIFPLPNGMFFIVNNEDNFLEVFDAEVGFGHEPHMIKKLINFALEGETYVEIGANYGDFALQMSYKLGNKGKIYAFEPGRKVFECLDLSVKLNGLSDVIVTENLAISDKQQDVIFVETGEEGAGTLGSHVVVGNKSENDNIVQATTIDAYFENINSSIDILRFDVEGSECKVLKGAEKIIASSPNIRIFVEWQRPLLEKYESEESMKKCLSNLEEKNFIFLDASHLSNSCDHSIFKLSSDDILKSNHLEILAIREDTLKLFQETAIDQSYCFNAMNYYLYLASLRGNIESVKNLLSLGADPNSISGLEGNSFGANSLHIAAENGDKDLVITLLNAGANIESIAPANELTPLCIAAQNKHSDIVQLLIKNGANVDCVYPSGANALYVSAYLGDIKTAIMLLKAGASQDIIIEDKNIIDRANQSGNTEAAKLFELGVEAFCQQTLDIQFVEVCGKESNEHVIIL